MFELLAIAVFCHSNSPSGFGPQWLRVDEKSGSPDYFAIPNLFAPSGQMYAVKPSTSVPPPKGHVTPSLQFTHKQLSDAYARAVLRSLQQTMPKWTGVVCRITVRVKLSGDGKILGLSLLQKSSDQALNQRVIAAVKATSLPLAPFDMTDADRTFTVSYVYN
jgi:TonB family protein